MSDPGLELLIEVRHRGVPVASEPASLGPLVEAMRFRGVLTGALPNDGAAPSFEVTPRERSSRFGTLEAVTLEHELMPAHRFERAVFAPQARAVLERLVRERSLGAGETLEWDLITRTQAEAPPRFRTRVSGVPYPFEPRPLPQGPPGGFAVEVAAPVLAALRAAYVAAGPIEVASLLLGRLLHDPERRCAVLRVDDSVPVEAGSGGASGSHFAFGPETFRDARDKLLARSDTRLPIGWAHTHPVCEACPANPACRSDTVFFSTADEQVHHAAFDAAYMAALVVGKTAARTAREPGIGLYGWTDAAIGALPLRTIDLTEDC